ncbi:G-D-S-L family lipolytic protein [Flavobacterium sp. LAR06]|uniref:G-D-S-L family lipolytic protein n=1 Tax=Flavobacterium sp. LAR06 TaxID=3064897 RepID=UPI0035BFA209
MQKKHQCLLLTATLVISACSSNNDSPLKDTSVTKGQANFTKYIALGDSYTAGYSDNALFIKGQEDSFPNILSQQFAAADGGTFAIPLMNDNVGGLLLSGKAIDGPRLFLNNGIPTQVSGLTTTEATNNLTGPFNNFGIPGAKSFHLRAPSYGDITGVLSETANPYFARFASSPTTTVISDAIAGDATFFSVFIGGNDILSYAISGGTGRDQTGNKNYLSYDNNDVTDPGLFADTYSALIEALTTKDAKGVLANIPYVSTLPYFTTVHYNSATLTQALADQLNNGYDPYNQGLQKLAQFGILTTQEAERRTINFTAGNNAIVIEDKHLTDLTQHNLPSYRQATKEDLLVLTSSYFIGTLVNDDPLKVNGLSVPLADKWVLTPEETTLIIHTTDVYNMTINTIAQTKGLALADIKSVMNKLHDEEIIFENIKLTSKYITGGVFSLDGIHLSARGNALISNVFIEAINEKYKSTLKKVDLRKYPVNYTETIH